MLANALTLPNTQNRSNYRYFLVFLALFILPISGLSIDIYVPSLPAVSTYFGIDIGLAQLTITAYMMGLGGMQLLAGPISDSFGRRTPYLVSMFFYILATLAIPFSPSIHFLLFLRFIQGVMVAVMVVPLRSIISDLFEGPEYYKMVNYMTMAWSIGPIIAPMIGGYLQHYFGWKSNFVFLSAYASISFLLNLMLLPDTSTKHHPFQVIKIFERYKEIISNKVFILSILTNSLLYSIIILFAIVTPFLFQNVLHYTPIQFGHIALLSGLAWFTGGILSRLLVYIPHYKKSKIAVWSMLTISIIFLLIDFFIPMNFFLIVTPVILFEVIGGINFSNNFARGVALFPNASGSANALFSAFVFLISGMVSGLGALLKTNSLLPLAITYVVIVVMLVGLHYLQKACE